MFVHGTSNKEELALLKKRMLCEIAHITALFRGRVHSNYIINSIRKADKIFYMHKTEMVDVSSFMIADIVGICTTRMTSKVLCASVGSCADIVCDLELIGSVPGYGKYIMNHLHNYSEKNFCVLYLSAIDTASNFYIDSGWFSYVLSQKNMNPIRRSKCYLMFYVPKDHPLSHFYKLSLAITHSIYCKEKKKACSATYMMRIKYEAKRAGLRAVIKENRTEYTRFFDNFNIKYLK
jgi:hypothetical protein